MPDILLFAGEAEKIRPRQDHRDGFLFPPAAQQELAGLVDTVDRPEIAVADQQYYPAAAPDAPHEPVDILVIPQVPPVPGEGDAAAQTEGIQLVRGCFVVPAIAEEDLLVHSFALFRRLWEGCLCTGAFFSTISVALL